jgi:hypothetical protein
LQTLLAHQLAQVFLLILLSKRHGLPGRAAARSHLDMSLTHFTHLRRFGSPAPNY